MLQAVHNFLQLIGVNTCEIMITF